MLTSRVNSFDTSPKKYKTYLALNPNDGHRLGLSMRALFLD